MAPHSNDAQFSSRRSLTLPVRVIERKMPNSNEFYYSDRYEDDEYEYRHVHVPKEVARLVPKNRLLSESEWRSLGIQQSPGWIHYMIHTPERHVLLFRRPKTIDTNAKAKECGQVGVH